MNNSNKQIKLKFFLLLPLLASMVVVGFYNSSNANQSDSLNLNQTGIDNSMFPVIGYASLELNGVTLTGFTSLAQVGDVDLSSDFIEFFTYRHEIKTGSDDGSRLSGRITVGPITITKRIDQTTPLLAQGLGQNMVVEGFFIFFAVDPSSGQTSEAFRISIMQGRVISLRTFTVVGETGSQLVEEVSFSYRTILWEDVQNGAVYEYSWSATA